MVGFAVPSGMLCALFATCVLLPSSPQKPGPTLLVLNKRENTVWLIDLKSGNPRHKLPTGPNPNEVAVSPHQTLAAISDMGTGPTPPGTTLTMVDIPNGKVVNTWDIKPHGAPHGLCWLRPDRLLFTSHLDDSVVEINPLTGKLGRVIATTQKGTHLVVMSGDQHQAFAVNAVSGTVSAIDFISGKITAQIPAGARAEGISISPDGNRVACGNVGANTVTIIDAKTNQVMKTITDIGAPIRTVFSADGKHLLVSSVSERTVVVFNTQGWERVATVDIRGKPAIADYGDEWPVPMNFWRLKNGNILVVLVTSHAVAEIAAKTWKVVRLIDTGALPDGIAVAEP